MNSSASAMSSISDVVSTSMAFNMPMMPPPPPPPASAGPSVMNLPSSGASSSASLPSLTRLDSLCVASLSPAPLSPGRSFDGSVSSSSAVAAAVAAKILPSPATAHPGELSDPARPVNLDVLSFPQPWGAASFPQAHGIVSSGIAENSTIEHIHGSEALLSPLPSSSFYSSHGQGSKLKFSGGADHLVSHDPGLALLEAVKSPFLHFDSIPQEAVSTPAAVARKSPFGPKWSEAKFPSSEFLRRKPIPSTGMLPSSSQPSLGIAADPPLASPQILTSQPDPKSVVFMTEMKGNHPNYFGSACDPSLGRKILPADKMPASSSNVSLSLNPGTSINLATLTNADITEVSAQLLPLIPKSVEDSHMMISVDDDDDEEVNLIDFGTSPFGGGKSKIDQTGGIPRVPVANSSPFPSGVRLLDNTAMPRSSKSSETAIRILPDTSSRPIVAPDLTISNQIRLVPSPPPRISGSVSGPPVEVQFLEQNFTLAPNNPSPIRLVPSLISPQISVFPNAGLDAKQVKTDEREGPQLMKSQAGPTLVLSEEGSVLGTISTNVTGKVAGNPAEPLEVLVPTPVPARKSEFIEPVSCFKCADCGFLGMTEKAVENHAVAAHGIDLGSTNDWLSMAQAEGIKLQCPFCPNTFNAEGSRSFKVHVMDDHGVNEGDAEHHFKECQDQRRRKTLEATRKKREREREERKRVKRDTLEAYVNDKGELRVRNVRRAGKKTSEKATPVTVTNPDDIQEVDVTAEEYADAIKIGKRIEKDRKKGLVEDIPGVAEPDQRQKILIGLSSRSRRRDPSSDSDKDLESEEEDDDVDIDIETLAPVPCGSKSSGKDNDGVKMKRRVGRPKGSRSLGLTKLKRLNRDIEFSEEQMGSECGVRGCAVRLKDAEKLEYHRKCHAEGKAGAPASVLSCPECTGAYTDWQRMSMHLWNKHRIDMELYNCDVCHSYKSYSLARVETHKICHKVAKPFLCDDCGKGFKTNRNLKLHIQTHRRKSLPESSAKQLECSQCSRRFREQRRLKHHVETVHQKLRPHLCNYCGYSASSKSSLRLHLRLHTGEKPYSCPECSYRSNDHNALRRHKLRHSGVKPYKCPYCSYSSIQSSTYVVHLRNKHPKESESHLFSCQNCPFKSLQKDAYLAHLASHKDKKNVIAKSATKNSQSKSEPQAKDQPEKTRPAEASFQEGAEERDAK